MSNKPNFYAQYRPRLWGAATHRAKLFLCAVGRPNLAAHSNLLHKKFSGKFVAAHRGFARRARLSSPGRRNTIVFNIFFSIFVFLVCYLHLMPACTFKIPRNHLFITK